MPSALFGLPPRLRTPVEESQAGSGSFSGRGWAVLVATAGQVLYTPPMAPDIDLELWIVAEGFEARCFLLGNSHTFPGRMLLWNEQQDVVASVSKYAITQASEASRRWIEGFLVGNEPSLAAYLGMDRRVRPT